MKKHVTFDVLKDKESNEATNKVFRDLKGRNKIRRKYLKAKITRA